MELSLKSSLDAQLKDAAKKLNAFGKSATRVGGGLLAGGGAVAGGILGGAMPQIQELAQLNSAGKALGSTGEGASKLFGALKSVGGDFKEDLEGITQFLAKVEDAASGKDGEGAKLFDGLAVSAQELMRLPLEEKFFKIHEAIRQLPQDQQMGKLAMLGGTDSMKKWLDLLAVSNDELRRRGDAAAVTQADLDRATEASRADAEATGAVDRAWKQVAVGAAPAVQFLAEQVVALVQGAVGWLKENREMAAVIALVATGAAAAGAALVGVGGAIALAGAAGSALVGALAAVKGVILAALSPLGLAAAAVAGLGYLFFTQTDLGREWAAGIGAYFSETAANAKTAYGGIVDAVKGGDLQLAWQVASTFVQLEWARAVAAMTGAWNQFKDFFVDGWHDGVYLLENVWNDFTAWAGKLFIDMLAAARRAFGETVGDMLRLVGKVPGLAPFANAAAFGADAVGLAGADRLKAGIEAERQRVETELNRAKQEADEARRNARLQDLQGAEAEVIRLRKQLDALAESAERKRNTKIFADFMAGLQGDGPGGGAVKAKLDQVSSTAGVFAGQAGGYLSQALGSRNAGPMVNEAKRTNKLLEVNNDLLARIAGGPGLVFG